MAGGELDWLRARVLSTELADASPEVVAEVEERLYPAVLKDSAGEARRRCRRVLERVDAPSVLERVRRAREGRRLERWTSEPEVTQWHAVLPAEQAATAWEAVDALARRYQQEDREHGDRPATVDQARSDALIDLILGNATVQTSVVFTVPETFASGAAPASPDAETVVDAAGVGPLPWSAIGPLTTAFATRISLASCDPGNGSLTGMATEVYRPPAALDRFIKARDGRCRFPGCGASVSRCDTGHVVPWPAGPTDQTNLVSLCRRHHRTKQRPGWRVRLDPGGVTTWTNPLGRSFTTQPIDHLNAAASQPPDHLNAATSRPVHDPVDSGTTRPHPTRWGHT
jgi:hypothetical protein